MSPSGPIRHVPTGCRLELRVHADVRLELGVGVHRRPGQELLGDIGCQCRLLGEPARQPHAGGERLEIGLRLQEVEPDGRRRQWIRALDVHAATAVRTQMHRAQAEARETDAPQHASASRDA